MTSAPLALLDFFKALADETRLKIVGLLAQAPRTGDELAAILALSAATVSHHLARLHSAGLVAVEARQHHHVYSLRFDVLQATARELLARETLGEVAAGVDQDAYARQVLAHYLVRGRLKEIPSQLKKKEVIVRWLAGRFEPGRRYREKEVNALIAAAHPDFATLRRELISMKLLARTSGGIYWRRGAADE
jgi:biotin operon repressor